VIVALDFATAPEALAFVARVNPPECRLKIGLELYTAEGPALVRALIERGFEVFLDLKFHDIPTTVARACRVAADLGVWMLNVHTLGGPAMLRAAREAVDKANHRPLLIGVSVLTSHDAGELARVGLATDTGDEAARLSMLAKEAGLDGVVCSAREASRLRAQHGGSFVLVTPGVRPAGTAADDQSRTASPSEAIRLGADYLVVGRPITRAADPLAALSVIRREIGEA
jgi:orotidine-5'-phosphate decarboxylase